MTAIPDLQQFLPQTPFELVSDTVSVVAIATPWWLPLLQETSEIAAYLLPILGVVWLAIQIGFKFYSHFRSP